MRLADHILASDLMVRSARSDWLLQTPAIPNTVPSIQTAPTVCRVKKFALRPRTSANILTDGNEYNRNGLVPGNTALKRDITSMTRACRNYLTKNGRTIYVSHGANVGDIVWTPKSYDQDLEFDLDEILRPLNATIL
jgi:hypothetical protein